jgi:putative hydrolases of HD superfamily
MPVISTPILVQKTPRTGWVRSGVQKPESVSDHMYRMSLLALSLSGSQYDHVRLVKMALIHDLAEALVGDIAPSDGISDAEKYRRESEAMKEIQVMLGADTAVAREIIELWYVT